MTQAILFLAIHLVGVAVCLALGPRHRPALCGALGFPIGLAVVVLSTLLLLLAHVPYTPWTLGAVVVVPIAAAVVRLRRIGVERGALVVVAWWTAGFAALVPALAAADFVIMTHDSHIFVMFGGVVATDGGLAPDMLAQLDEWGVFQVVAQSMVQVTREDFLYALPATLGLSLVPVFALTLWHGLGAIGAPLRRRGALVALATLALFSNHMVVFHVFYLHSNMGSAVYLFGFVVLFWLAEVERDPATVAPAMICLTALALQRTETAIVAVLFLCLTVAQSELPRATITRWLAVFVVVVGAWYETLAWNVGADGAFLTPTRCRIVEAVLLGAFGWWWLSDRPAIRRVNRLLPLIIAAGTALLLVGAFAARTSHMTLTAERWLGGLLTLPHWGVAWYAFAGLALLGLLVPAPRFRQAFVVGLPVFLGFIQLLGMGRDPYRQSIDDSANRMAMHVVPLIVWYLGLKAGAALRSGPTAEPGATTARYSEP